MAKPIAKPYSLEMGLTQQLVQYMLGTSCAGNTAAKRGFAADWAEETGIPMIKLNLTPQLQLLSYYKAEAEAEEDITPKFRWCLELLRPLRIYYKATAELGLEAK